MHRTLAIASLLLSILAAAPAAAQWQRPPERWARPVFDPALADACERAFDGDYNEQRCLQIVGRARHAPAARDAIGACERAFDGDANELACIDAAALSRYEPVSLIEWCERSASGDAAELACIQRFR